MKKLLIACVVAIALGGCAQFGLFGPNSDEVVEKCEAADILKTCQAAQVYGVLGDLQLRFNKVHREGRISTEDFTFRTNRIAEAEALTEVAENGDGDLGVVQSILDELLAILVPLEGEV